MTGTPWLRRLPLSAIGYRVFAPYLRGFGPTRFISETSPRSGQQAALGTDLFQFMAALSLPPAILIGYGWGGRAACVVSAIGPQRVRGLVSITGYNIQNIPEAGHPADAEQELRYWYQWYLQTERGKVGLTQNRRELCRLLWNLWSPNWRFEPSVFERTAVSFENPDFVDVTVHSYRHRYACASGDPTFEPLETRLALQPVISVPALILHGAADGVDRADHSVDHAKHFSHRYERHVVPQVGHFLPREAPECVLEAINGVCNWTK